MKIRNWEEFQHFKDRTPPWIKLYRYLLDDPEWHVLSGDDSKVLVMLWLIASEDKLMDGNLPNIKTLSFRLRITENKLAQSLTSLSHWLILDDINEISDLDHLDDPEERQRERQRQRQIKIDIENNFNKFWNAYPKKIGKDLALKSWLKVTPILQEVLTALIWQKELPQWKKDNGQFIKNPSTYLNQASWKDEKFVAIDENTEIPDWLKKVSYAKRPDNGN